MAELSPAAQAVLDAVKQVSPAPADEIAAAALRAAADQVVPHEPVEAFTFTNEAIRLNRMGIRAKLLAIATELDS